MIEARPLHEARTTPAESILLDVGVPGSDARPHACMPIMGLSIGEKGLLTHPITLPLKIVESLGVDLERRCRISWPYRILKAVDVFLSGSEESQEADASVSTGLVDRQQNDVIPHPGFRHLTVR